MVTSAESIQLELAPLRRALAEHPLYATISSIQDLRTFTEHHVVAVWDFMSLVSSLRSQLVCNTVPWLPLASGSTRRFVNEIALGEESDVLPDGRNFTSHFELYCSAMQGIGASTEKIDTTIRLCLSGIPPLEALHMAHIPQSATLFAQQTFAFATPGMPHITAAALCWGREDVIPTMFRAFVAELQNNGIDASLLLYYLDRHIELDGDQHGKASLELVSELCGNDPVRWQEASRAAVSALRARLDFWDSIYTAIVQQKESLSH